MIRGVVGARLRERFCVSPGLRCSRCIVLFHCPFGYLYRAPSKGVVLRGLESVVKPYVVKPPLDPRVLYRRGDVIRFSLALFGDALRFEDAVLQAVMDMCHSGLGTREGRARLRLRCVYVENPYRGRKEVLMDQSGRYRARLYITSSDLDRSIPKDFTLNFLTPFRLIKQGTLLSTLEFRGIAPYLLRKYTTLYWQYLNAQPDIDVYAALREAERVALVAENLRLVRFIYRGRPEEYLHGSIAYHGRLGRDMRRPLRLAELIHIGKRATYGHGWPKITAPT